MWSQERESKERSEREMKRMWLFIIALIICICPTQVYATSGSIQVSLPEDANSAVVHYAKIAECEQFQEKELAKWLEDDVEFSDEIKIDEKGFAQISGLEEGVYRIRVSGDEMYQFSDAIISLPTWDDERECMLYDVEVNPKYVKMTNAPDTGDESKGMVYLFFGVISFIIVIIISCHKRFKCGRM